MCVKCIQILLMSDLRRHWNLFYHLNLQHRLISLSIGIPIKLVDFNPMLSIFPLIFCRSEFQYRNGGDWGVLPGPTNPWYQAGSPVQCWNQHFGARPEPCWQHDQQEQKFWEYITNSCTWIGRLSGVLWHWCEFLPSLFYLIPTRPPQG